MQLSASSCTRGPGLHIQQKQACVSCRQQCHCIIVVNSESVRRHEGGRHPSGGKTAPLVSTVAEEHSCPGARVSTELTRALSGWMLSPISARGPRIAPHEEVWSGFECHVSQTTYDLSALNACSVLQLGERNQPRSGRVAMPPRPRSL